MKPNGISATIYLLVYYIYGITYADEHHKKNTAELDKRYSTSPSGTLLIRQNTSTYQKKREGGLWLNALSASKYFDRAACNVI